MPLDDDDVDLFGPPKTNQELSSLLADISAEKRTDPTPTAPAAATTRSLAENERATVEVERATLEAPDGYHSLYESPGSMPWEKIAYAYRVLTIRTKSLERAVFVARDAEQARRALPDAQAELGRAVHDAAGARPIDLPPDAIDEIRFAMEALSSLSAARDDIRRIADRQGALASARRESAAASLDPVTQEQNRALHGLEASERNLERAKAASTTAEARLAEAEAAQSADVPAIREAVEAARREHAAAARATRDAALAYAEVRRRAVLQMGRVAEADQAVEGARVEARRAGRELARREDDALKALREAYSKLGALAFGSKLGPSAAPSAFEALKAAHDRIEALEATAAALRDRAKGYDVAAARDGGTYALALLAFLFVVVVGVAVFA